ncbi:hypothetical protein [Thalassospira sp.]|uniref:hypothetical protein n=1 Tax=Thalassospira sp. TaxID=1912094 RepID=UPI003AA7AB7D
MLLIKKHWRLLVGAWVALIGLPALFMTIDASCSPISNAFCRQWLNFQWETVLAGYAGFAGAAIALYGIAMQIRQDNKNQITGQMHFPLKAAETMREMAEIAAPLHEKLRNLGTCERVELGPSGVFYKLTMGHRETVARACTEAIKTMHSHRAETVQSIRDKHTESIPHEALAHIDKVLRAFKFDNLTKHDRHAPSIQYGMYLHHTARRLEMIVTEATKAADIIERAYLQMLDTVQTKTGPD